MEQGERVPQSTLSSKSAGHSTSARGTQGTQYSTPTEYRDTWFRSRLEAKWAAFFHTFELEYQYEPFLVSGHYTPDFLLNHPIGPVLIEIKPEDSTNELRSHTKRCESVSTHEHSLPGILLLGVDPYIGALCYSARSSWQWHELSPTSLWGNAYSLVWTRAIQDVKVDPSRKSLKKDYESAMRSLRRYHQ